MADEEVRKVVFTWAAPLLFTEEEVASAATLAVVRVFVGVVERAAAVLAAAFEGREVVVLVGVVGLLVLFGAALLFTARDRVFGPFEALLGAALRDGVTVRCVVAAEAAIEVVLPVRVGVVGLLVFLAATLPFAAKDKVFGAFAVLLVAVLRVGVTRRCVVPAAAAEAAREEVLPVRVGVVGLPVFVAAFDAGTAAEVVAEEVRCGVVGRRAPVAALLFACKDRVVDADADIDTAEVVLPLTAEGPALRAIADAEEGNEEVREEVEATERAEGLTERARTVASLLSLSRSERERAVSGCVVVCVCEAVWGCGCVLDGVTALFGWGVSREDALAAEEVEVGVVARALGVAGAAVTDEPPTLSALRFTLEELPVRNNDVRPAAAEEVFEGVPLRATGFVALRDTFRDLAAAALVLDWEPTLAVSLATAAEVPRLLVRGLVSPVLSVGTEVLVEGAERRKEVGLGCLEEPVSVPR